MGVDCHQRNAHNSKQQHQDVIGGASSKVSLLQQAAVPYQKVHVEQEINGKDAKEQVAGFVLRARPEWG